MCNPFQFTVRSRFEERERIFKVGRSHRIMCQLFRGMFPQNEIIFGNAKLHVPVVPSVAPIAVPIDGLAGMAEELHFHLLKLTRTECEIARRNLVAKAFSNLSNSEGNLDAAGITDVLEIDE